SLGASFNATGQVTGMRAFNVSLVLRMTSNIPLELLTVPEAARRLSACSITLKRHIAKAGIIPDAVLLEGASQRRSPLFVAPRLPQLAKLLDINPQNIAL